MFTYKALVTGVYDGDSITVDVDLGFKCWLKDVKLRLYGIDTPEVRGPERPEGLFARDIVRQKILDKYVTLVTYKDKTGKYGRWLADVYPLEADFTDRTQSINHLLVQEGLAEVNFYD